MKKNNKKKIVSGAAVAATAAGAVAGATVLSEENVTNVNPNTDSVDDNSVIEGEEIAEAIAIEDSAISDGGKLPEVVIVGSHVASSPAESLSPHSVAEQLDGTESQIAEEGQLLNESLDGDPEVPVEQLQESSLLAQNASEEPGDMEDEIDPDEPITRQGEPTLGDQIEDLLNTAEKEIGKIFNPNSGDEMSDTISTADVSPF